MANDLKNYDPVLMMGGVISDAGETITGNATISGTLAVTGATTLTGALASGAQTITGTMSVSGVTTLTGGSTNPTSTITASAVASSTVGGATTPALYFSSTDGLGLYFGTGYPTVTAAQGSLYTNRTGTSTSTRVWVNYGGTAGWNSLTTSA